MGFGKRLRELWRMKAGVAVCLVLALIAAVWSLENVSLFPPKLTARSLEMATASTHVVVDTPRSTLLDLRQDTYELEALTKRAVLLGNVIANGPVKESIARRAGIPVEVLRVEAPAHRRAATPANRGREGEEGERHPALHRPVPPEHPGQPDRAHARHLRTDADRRER